MYYPKTLSRFSPKIERPITLKALATDASLKLIVFSGLTPSAPAGGEPAATSVTAAQKEELAVYLQQTLPRTLHSELFTRAVEKWYGAERICSLIDVFWNTCIGETSMDFIGPFRYAYGCYYSEARLYWSNGTIERLNLDKNQCDQLFKTIRKGQQERKIRSLAISTQKDAMRTSKLPAILARGEALHSVVILNGATDHILRLLGLNCHNLKLLDVSHSQGVSNQGLRNLLLRNPRPPRTHDQEQAATVVNPCALGLSRIIILGTEVDTQGHEFAAKVIEGYSITFIPDSMVYKPQEKQSIFRGLALDTGNFLISLRIAETLGIGQDDAEAIQRTASRFVEFNPLGHEDAIESTQILDWFSDKKGESQMFIRLPDSRIPQAYLRMELNKVTQLILPWSSFTWRIPNLPDLTELATSLPNLTHLKARVQGVWDRPNEEMWPKLRHTYIWTIHDSTVISFMRHCPAIISFKFNCLDFSHLYNVDPIHLNSLLIDDHVRAIMESNPTLMQTLVEVSIRPASKLTVQTVNFFIDHCPNLERLGDMESWDVTADTLKTVNRRLDQVNSKCVLTVLSFPPFDNPSYLL